MINPYFCAAYKNVVILCGINDIKQDRVKNPTDVKNIFNLLSCKIEQIQSLNPKAHVFVCPVLPTKLADIKRRAVYFNNLIFNELSPTNFGVTVVNGFNCFVDENDLLSKDLSKHLNRYKKLDN